MPGFSDVLGHEQTIAHMKSAIEANKVSHAYLLAGEKGSGKKMLAGIFARTLQCEAQGNVTPAYRQRAAISRTLSM